MSKLWRQFVSLFDEPDTAVVGFIVAIGGVVAAIALPVYFLTIGRYASAVCLIVALGVASGVCIRDYRRGKWSILSGALLAIWLLISAAVAAYCWYVAS